MSAPKVIIMSGYGLNSELESKVAFCRAGAEVEIVHINDLIDGHKKLLDYQIFMVPGGFSFGDDTGSGNAYANRIKNNLGAELAKFMQEDRLVIGVCNGFQVLVNLGLLPGFDNDYTQRKIALMPNTSAHVECRWVKIRPVSQQCVWLKNLQDMHVPIAHGEGRLTTDTETLQRLKDQDQIAFQYVDEKGNLAQGKFPANPNGATEDIAGVCDETGRVLGLMPHPERTLSFFNEEGWTRKKEQLLREGQELPTVGIGQAIFENGVKYFK
ncbi:MAG: phosphoribosylformylglycinamidine synthase I [Candidatus Gracilibacteria bacterium]|nr:phosphoribosylformylglycinamidine synthase I [Candidatus Gracilibacteria bacterium]